METRFLEYLLLFGTSLLAATILPFSSELVLFALLKDGGDSMLLLLSATAGNTIGALINWGLGLYLIRFQNRSWFYFKPQQIAAAQRWFQRYGQWSLLFSWVPMGGDVLTLVAGALRVHWLPFLILVATGKCLRYLVIIYLTGPL